MKVMQPEGELLSHEETPTTRLKPRHQSLNTFALDNGRNEIFKLSQTNQARFEILSRLHPTRLMSDNIQIDGNALIEPVQNPRPRRVKLLVLQSAQT